MKFEGNYHGHADHLLVAVGSGVAAIANASSAGGPNDFVRHTAVLPYNDCDALKDYFQKNGDRVAAPCSPCSSRTGRCAIFQDTKRSDQERFARYFRSMLRWGIYVSPRA